MSYLFFASGMNFTPMQNGVIKLKEALEIFNRRDQFGKPVPFDVKARTFSGISKSGGQLRTYQNATYLPSADPNKQKEITVENLFDPVTAAKDPQHFKNRTRNLQLEDGQCRKILIDFIISVNDQTVIY